MVNVLVVEDSPVVREFLVHILSSDPLIHVIGTASDGHEALEAVGRQRPDVITMDIHMPKMGGLDATRRIMETHPTPIVIVSGSTNAKEVATAFHAIEAGALAFVERPAGIGHPEHEATAAALIQMVKLMAEVKVIRRWPRLHREALAALAPSPLTAGLGSARPEIQIAAIGASTGGPPVLRTILSGLPNDFSIPVLIVQHMAAGFVQGFVEWLGEACSRPVRLASHGERILHARVYVAPDGLQMKVDMGGTLSLVADEPENGHRPSVSYLFRSTATVYGPRAVGVLLTGMGKDGADGLKRMKQEGAITIAQDKDSSVVHGMPGEAIELEAVTYVLSPDQMVATLASLTSRSSETGRSLGVSYEEKP